MKEKETFLNQLSSFLGSYYEQAGLGGQEPLIVTALLFSLLALLFALAGLTRRRAAKSEVTSGQINNTVQELLLKVNDMSGRWNREYTRLNEESQILKKKVDDLSEELKKNF